MGLHNNSLQVVRVNTSERDSSVLYSVDFAGHRSDVRVVAFSRNDELFLTASHGSPPRSLPS